MNPWPVYFKFNDVEELKSHQITEFYKNISARKEIIDKLRKEGSFAQYEVEMVSREGDAVNMLLSASLTGKVISGMLMNITQRKKAEKALQDSEEKYHTLFKSNPTYTILISLEGAILDVNSAASKFASISSPELLVKASRSCRYSLTKKILNSSGVNSYWHYRERPLNLSSIS